MTLETLNGQEVLRLHPGIYRGRLSRRAGWRMLPGGVNCARPGRWGNPYRVGVDGDAQACVERYAMAVAIEKCRSRWLLPGLVAQYECHGRIILYCWCKLGDPCHCTPLADALAAELERTP